MDHMSDNEVEDCMEYEIGIDQLTVDIIRLHFLHGENILGLQLIQDRFGRLDLD